MDCAQAGGPRFQSATEETAPYTAVASVRKKEMLLPRFCADYILIFQGKHGKILNQMSQIQLIFFQEALRCKEPFGPDWQRSVTNVQFGGLYHTMYQHLIKRLIDFTLSLAGILILAIPMLLFALVVKLDSPGPVLFWQKRVGIHKKTFMMPKFRTMYTNTPANMPTHLLSDPQKWITRSGAWFRRLSIDELPQILCILTGKMSVTGPRPALWNQDDLIAERDKYGANGVRPGLTGWAQINGRDELEIPVKARLDGEYVQNLSFLFDCRCFFGTIGKVLKHDGVVEGGTGVLQEEKEPVHR